MNTFTCKIYAYRTPASLVEACCFNNYSIVIKKLIFNMPGPSLFIFLNLKVCCDWFSYMVWWSFKEKIPTYMTNYLYKFKICLKWQFSSIMDKFFQWMIRWQSFKIQSRGGFYTISSYCKTEVAMIQYKRQRKCPIW